MPRRRADWGMAEITETPLPGVGTRHELSCIGGRRVGVVTRHSGRRELVVYDQRDPDAAETSIELTVEESRSLAELLGGATVTQQLAGVVKQVEGLAIDWLSLPLSFEARTIGDTEMRARTGVSIIALVRGEQPLPAPGPDATLEPGDTVVVTGTPEGIERAASLLGL